MRSLNDIFLTCNIPDISTADSVFIAAPDNGEVTKVFTTIANAITVANATITPKIGGVAMTNGAVTIAYTGSAAGDVDTSAPSAANSVTEGQSIEIATDGGSTTACQATVTVVISR